MYLISSKIFILFGTLLAYKRYDGKHMIPHDDDLDTGILAEHENLLKKAHFLSPLVFHTHSFSRIIQNTYIKTIFYRRLQKRPIT